MANARGFNPTPFASVDTGRYHHWVITVRGNQMLAILDGKPYQPVDLDTGFGNKIVIRDMKISRIRASALTGISVSIHGVSARTRLALSTWRGSAVLF
jgi:hypothetical protein